MDRHFRSVLWLDDNRMPLIPGIRWVKHYTEFVRYIEKNGIPDLICFDHDLDPEHYPVLENRPGMHIPYGSYKEKTGLEAARYIVENKLPLRSWSVHTLNAQGRLNIEAELRAYCPQGEVRGLRIPFRIVSPEEAKEL